VASFISVTAASRLGEVTEMNEAPMFPHQKLDAYLNAKELARRVIAAKIRNTELRDQAERAATSQFLQLAEGLPNDSMPMRRRYFVGARNSLFELVGATDLSRTIGALDDGEWLAIQHLAAKQRAMLVALLRG
jgi:four helix bundle protein